MILYELTGQNENNPIYEALEVSNPAMGSDHPNYLFLFSLYAAYTCCFLLKSCFEARKTRSKRIMAPLHEILLIMQVHNAGH